MSLVELDARHVTVPDLSDPATFADGVPHEAFAQLRRIPGPHWQPTEVSTANGGFRGGHPLS